MKRFAMLFVLLVVLTWISPSPSYAACQGGWQPQCTSTPGYNNCFNYASSDYSHCRSLCYSDYCYDNVYCGPGGGYVYTLCVSQCDTEKACDQDNCRQRYCEIGCSPADPNWPSCGY